MDLNLSIQPSYLAKSYANAGYIACNIRAVEVLKLNTKGKIKLIS